MKALGQESTVKKFQQARMPTSMRTSHLKPTKTRFWIFLLDSPAPCRASKPTLSSWRLDQAEDLTISLRSRQDVVQKEWRQQEKLGASGAPNLLRVSGMLLTQFCALCLAIGHGAAALPKKLGSRLSDSNYAEAIKLYGLGYSATQASEKSGAKCT